MGLKKTAETNACFHRLLIVKRKLHLNECSN